MWFSIELLSETFLILRNAERDMINMFCEQCVQCVQRIQYLLFRHVLMKIEFLKRFSKNL